MATGNVVQVHRISSGGGEWFVIVLVDCRNAIVWSTPALGKDAAFTQLLEIGVPAYRIPLKFAEAQTATY